MYEKKIIIITIITAGACYAGFLLQGYPDYRFLGYLLPIRPYSGRLRPKEVPLSSFMHMRRQGFHELMYVKG